MTHSMSDPALLALGDQIQAAVTRPAVEILGFVLLLDYGAEYRTLLEFEEFEKLLHLATASLNGYNAAPERSEE